MFNLHRPEFFLYAALALPPAAYFSSGLDKLKPLARRCSAGSRHSGAQQRFAIGSSSVDVSSRISHTSGQNAGQGQLDGQIDRPCARSHRACETLVHHGSAPDAQSPQLEHFGSANIVVGDGSQSGPRKPSHRGSEIHSASCDIFRDSAPSIELFFDTRLHRLRRVIRKPCDMAGTATIVDRQWGWSPSPQPPDRCGTTTSLS